MIACFEVEWIRYDDGGWCELEGVLSDFLGDAAGVYAIWHGGDNPRWVRVGQGIFSQRFGQHRHDRRITAYDKYGPLYVTWALVDLPYRDGVEAYLAKTLDPLVGERFPNRLPLAVNLPE